MTAIYGALIIGSIYNVGAGLTDCPNKQESWKNWATAYLVLAIIFCLMDFVQIMTK
jgi:hypothetical protein